MKGLIRNFHLKEKIFKYFIRNFKRLVQYDYVIEFEIMFYEIIYIYFFMFWEIVLIFLKKLKCILTRFMIICMHYNMFNNVKVF